MRGRKKRERYMKTGEGGKESGRKKKKINLSNDMCNTVKYNYKEMEQPF